jgi:YidC/Oxa1 family membrane protein insertase
MENFKIDRNQIIGFVLIGLIMLWFAWWSTNNAPQKPAQQEKTTSEQPANATPTLPTAAEALDSLQQTTTDTSAVGAVVTDSTFVLENDRIRMAISSKGALITKVFLKKFQTWDSLPLNLIDSNQIMAFRAGDEASSIALNYTGTVQTTAAGQTLVLQSVESNKPKFKLTYALPAESYLVQLNVEATGLTKTSNHLFIDWQLDALRTEKSVSQERQKATIYFAEPEDEYDYLSVRGDDDDVKQNLRWIGYKQHFFSSILEPGIPITNSVLAIRQFEGETLTKRMKTENDLGQIGTSFSLPVTLFFGPNKYEILKSYDKGYQNVIDFGWGIFGWIGKGVVIPIFNWLEDYGMNYGIIILIMALIIKIVLFPLTYTSYKSMAKMKVLKPEMDAIAEKFKDKDPVKKNQATMELYQQAGVNPLGGCIPVLVQMPILLAMFNFFPASIELRQQPFLWAEDLSSFDAIISWQAHIPLLSEYYGNHISLFTVLMTISTLIYTWMNSQMQGNTNQIPGMKYIMYGMPIMLLFWFNSYSAGLSYYYFLANIITFSQQWLIRKTIDEDAIHAKIQEKRANPKQKSKFAERLEAAQKQAKAKR